MVTSHPTEIVQGVGSSITIRLHIPLRHLAGRPASPVFWGGPAVLAVRVVRHDSRARHHSWSTSREVLGAIHPGRAAIPLSWNRLVHFKRSNYPHKSCIPENIVKNQCKGVNLKFISKEQSKPSFPSKTDKIILCCNFISHKWQQAAFARFGNEKVILHKGGITRLVEIINDKTLHSLSARE